MATQVTLGSGVIDSASGLKLRTNGTTEAVDISTGQVATLAKDAVVNGLTVGRGAGAVSTNTAVGASALAANQAGGTNNTAIGNAALDANTTGDANTAVGDDALGANTTASNNTAVGYQAGYSGTTASDSTYLGQLAGYGATTGTRNTLVGFYTGSAITTGTFNNFFGTQAGQAVTTGGKNTILGSYSGNQGGLDIRTASNQIVLSDGDGNPKYWFDGSSKNTYVGNTLNVINEYKNTVDGLIGVFTIGASYDAASAGDMLIKKYTQSGYASPRIYIVSSTNGVYLAVNGTSWASASDERMKDIIEPITDAANKVSSLRAVIGKYKTDEEGTRRSFLIAQDIQAVLPEAVDATDSEKLGVQYTDVIPLLVAAIKELKAEIDALKGA